MRIKVLLPAVRPFIAFQDAYESGLIYPFARRPVDCNAPGDRVLENVDWNAALCRHTADVGRDRPDTEALHGAIPAERAHRLADHEVVGLRAIACGLADDPPNVVSAAFVTGKRCYRDSCAEAIPG